MKKNHFLKALYVLPLAATLTLGSCIEEEMPTSTASSGQLGSSSFAMLINGLNAKMISQTNYYGSGYRGTYYATLDWGYPCYMLWREVLLDGFPASDTNYNYQSTLEQTSNLTSGSAYPFYFYYGLINNANRILAAYPEEGATESVKQNLGLTRVYRALAYMDLTSMYEFYATGIAELDALAKNVMGLTVPIVTETTTNDEAKNNPRVPFYTMYRFIYNDLCKAESALRSFTRTEINQPKIDVVNGLLARFWLNMATRFRKVPADLTTQLAHEQDNDGGKALGITTAEECYRLAASYAQKVISAGYTPVTEEQWKNVKTGFNTANQAWVWDMRITSKEQFTDYWCSIMGLVASEPTWGMPSYGGNYRCISSRLFSKMQPGDWRKTSWVAPEDAGSKNVPAQYATLLQDETAATKDARTNFSKLPAYANLKFRPGSGSIVDDQTGMLCDIPLMRVEEMHFIKIECDYYLNGLAAGQAALEQFMNTYRNSEGTYSCEEANYSTAFVYEMIAQKMIEFWGEGILYNDYKRLRLAITRTYDGTNYLEVYQKNSKDGYCAPWLNFYIPEVERSFNMALEDQMNPDPTPYCN